MVKTFLTGPLTVKDLNWLLGNVMQWVNDAEVVKNFARFNHRFTRREERKILRQLLKSPNDKLFVIMNDKGEYIGQIGLNQIYWPSGTARLGIVVSKKDEWGRGHAQRAIKQLLAIAFKKLKLNKVWAIFYKTNKRMLYVTKKLGFAREGLLREEYFHNGKHHDMIRVAILKREWRKGRRKV